MNNSKELKIIQIVYQYKNYYIYYESKKGYRIETRHFKSLKGAKKRIDICCSF